MNVITFTTSSGGPCQKAGCRVPSVDIGRYEYYEKYLTLIFWTDWAGRLTVYYTINGSPQSWTVDEELETEKSYQVEIKQYKRNGKVKKLKYFFFFFLKNISVLV